MSPCPDDKPSPGGPVVMRQKWEDLKAYVERFVIACERGHFHIKKKP